MGRNVDKLAGIILFQHQCPWGQCNHPQTLQCTRVAPFGTEVAPLIMEKRCAGDNTVVLTIIFPTSISAPCCLCFLRNPSGALVAKLT